MNNNNTQEIWMTVDEYDNYQVSCFGRVRNIGTQRILKPGKSHGYYRVGLCKNGITKNHLVHRLVCFAFCNNDNDHDVVDHIDRNPLNNNYLNLRWVTQSMNQRNRTDNINNTSGTQGVSFEHIKWRARWTDGEGRARAKSFAIEKYGEEQARQMAIDKRLEMERLHGYL